MDSGARPCRRRWTIRWSPPSTSLWLAARSEGVGVGWVSILEPEAVTALLEVPPAWHLIGYLCLGFPTSEEEVPELEREGWQARLGACRTVLQR